MPLSPCQPVPGKQRSRSNPVIGTSHQSLFVLRGQTKETQHDDSTTQRVYRRPLFEEPFLFSHPSSLPKIRPGAACRSMVVIQGVPSGNCSSFPWRRARALISRPLHPGSSRSDSAGVRSSRGILDECNRHLGQRWYCCYTELTEKKAEGPCLPCLPCLCLGGTGGTKAYASLRWRALFGFSPVRLGSVRVSNGEYGHHGHLADDVSGLKIFNVCFTSAICQDCDWLGLFSVCCSLIRRLTCSAQP